MFLLFVLYLAVVVFIFLLLVWIVCWKLRALPRNADYPLRCLIVLGSGGHTTEMLRLLEGFITPSKETSFLLNKRFYVLAETDKMSFGKLVEFEEKLDNNCGSFEVLKIPRSREVRQSYLTSIYSTLRSILHCIPVVLKTNPDLVLVNGPGTCIPICFLAFLNRLRRANLIIFVESICRVESLSLSAKILYYTRFCDQIFVQWSNLKHMYGRSMYIGRLV